MIPFDPAELWLGSIIGSEPDTGIEMMVHIAITSLCEDRLTATCRIAYHASPDSGSGKPHMAVTPCGHVRPQGPSIPHRDDFVGQVRTILFQPPAQYRHDRHAIAYVSDDVQGECHCHHLRG
jgi:hypothetical protein